MAWTIADYRAEYSRADALAQEVQGFRNEAGIPAMNELRNAGLHFLKSLADDGTLASQADLDSAVNHARRASYEATEAGIILAVAVVKKFQNDYATVEVGTLVPAYAERCRKCNEALRLIEVGRQPGFDRSQDHQSRIDVFREVRPFADDLAVARVEANKKLAEKVRSTRRFIVTVALSLLAMAVAITLKAFV